MASLETWLKTRHFNPTERWGDASKISDDLVLRLDDFRHYIGSLFYITCGVKVSGHAENSYHYEKNGACAVDLVIPKYRKSIIDLIFDASRFGFTGIGYYPDWKYADKVVGGLHLDMRPLKWDKDETKNYKHNRWIGVLNDQGEREYIPLTWENLCARRNCGNN